MSDQLKFFPLCRFSLHPFLIRFFQLSTDDFVFCPSTEVRILLPHRGSSRIGPTSRSFSFTHIFLSGRKGAFILSLPLSTSSISASLLILVSLSAFRLLWTAAGGQTDTKTDSREIHPTVRQTHKVASRQIELDELFLPSFFALATRNAMPKQYLTWPDRKKGPKRAKDTKDKQRRKKRNEFLKSRST
mmetsp:Transcript_47783/g.94294  ORF Transcript_47783/g.94294 Transcript_47783/m.94294 type:complete len:188 (+) Transcript_47783:1027-1590(+)